MLLYNFLPNKINFGLVNNVDLAKPAKAGHAVACFKKRCGRTQRGAIPVFVVCSWKKHHFAGCDGPPDPFGATVRHPHPKVPAVRTDQLFNLPEKN